MQRETILPYALTTLQRVKDLLFDVNAQIAATASIGSGSAAVTLSTANSNIRVGMAIYGTGIPFGAYVLAISGTSLTLSANATATNAAASLTILNQQSDFDNVLIRMINSCTDWFEREAGSMRFLQTKYTNEIYSATGARQRFLTLKHAPVTCIIASGTTSSGSPVITGITSTAGMQAGMTVVNYSNFPIGLANLVTIASVDSATQITLSQNANATGSITFQVNGVVSFNWRAGTPNAPSWTAFIPDQYELLQDGKAGILRIYGVLPRLYDNMAQVTYWAGYLINWEYAGDATKHTLPSNVSATVENLVVRRFKRRQYAGKLSEGLEGASTTWDKELDREDKDVIEQYRLTPAFF